MTGSNVTIDRDALARPGWAAAICRLLGQLLTGLLVVPVILSLSSAGVSAQSAPADLLSTTINTTVSYDALANDGKDVHFGEVAQPAHGQTWSVGNGQISYLPAANYVGSDAFTYTAFGATGVAYTAAVSVTVEGTPTAVSTRDDQVSAQEDTPNWIAPLANDAVGPDGGYLTLTVDKAPRHGELTEQGDGSVIYTPIPDWHGTDSFTYTATDGITAAPGEVNITVVPVADLPKLQI